MAQTRQRKLIVPIILGALLMAALVGLVACSDQQAKEEPKETKQVEVPSVQYYYEEDAEEILGKAGLKLGKVTKEHNEESFEGLIINQSPAAKQTVDEGSTVDITVAEGRPIPSSFEVPDLKGLSPEEAEYTLIMAYLLPMPGEARYSDDVEPGKVCAQSVDPGTGLPMKVEDFKKGNWPVIVYFVSLGKEQVQVPDVTGKTSQEARDALTNAGLAVDTTTSYSDTVEQDHVVKQSVAKDTSVPKGTVVTIDISLGKKPVRVLVPDIRTYSFDEAVWSLNSAGLKYSYSGDESGRVIAVSPNPGTEVDQGSTVTFTIQRTVEQQRQEEQERQQREQQQREQQQQQEQQQQEQQQQQDQQQQQEQQQQEQQQSIIPDYTAIASAVSASGVSGAPEASATLVSEDPAIYLVHFVDGDTLYEVSVDAHTGDVRTVETIPVAEE